MERHLLVLERERESAECINKEWAVKKDKLCLTEREKEEVIHRNGLQTWGMSSNCICIQSAYNTNSAGIIKHSGFACTVSLSCFYLFCHFISSSPQSPLSFFPSPPFLIYLFFFKRVQRLL